MMTSPSAMGAVWRSTTTRPLSASTTTPTPKNDEEHRPLIMYGTWHSTVTKDRAIRVADSSEVRGKLVLAGVATADGGGGAQLLATHTPAWSSRVRMNIGNHLRSIRTMDTRSLRVGSREHGRFNGAEHVSAGSVPSLFRGLVQHPPVSVAEHKVLDGNVLPIRDGSQRRLFRYHAARGCVSEFTQRADVGVPHWHTRSSPRPGPASRLASR